MIQNIVKLLLLLQGMLLLVMGYSSPLTSPPSNSNMFSSRSRTICYATTGPNPNSNQRRGPPPPPIQSSVNGAEKVWQSGRVFTKNNNNNNRGQRGGIKDAWWMRDEEENNPRVLPKYKPSWLQANVVNTSWKVADLKIEAAKLGLKTTGRKEELIERINSKANSDDNARLLLSDSQFTAPRYVDPASSKPLTCFPEVYETAADIQKLRDMTMMQGPP
jgi:hypothetical protein